MEELYKKHPDPDDILKLAPEELAEVVLSILQKKEEVFCLHNCISEIPFAEEPRFGKDGYPQDRKYEIHLAVSEAFSWLRTQTLIIEKPENSEGIWMVLSRRARSMKVSSERAEPSPDPKMRKSAKGKSNDVGRINKNNQMVKEKTNLPGHANQKVHRMECLDCGYNYGANGYDCHLRKCPKCGDGAPGLPYE